MLAPARRGGLVALARLGRGSPHNRDVAACVPGYLRVLTGLARGATARPRYGIDYHASRPVRAWGSRLFDSPAHHAVPPTPSSRTAMNRRFRHALLCLLVFAPGLCDAAVR